MGRKYWKGDSHLEEAHELLAPLLGLVGDDGPVGLSLHGPQAHGCLCCGGDGNAEWLWDVDGAAHGGDDPLQPGAFGALLRF